MPDTNLPQPAPVIVNVVSRIELRAASPDPSLPHSGERIAFALAKRTNDHWWVYPRGGQATELAYEVADEAAARAALHRIAAEMGAS